MENERDYRKLISLVVTGVVVYALNYFGLTMHDLPAYGLSLEGIANPIADFIATYGIPAAVMVAQPSTRGKTLLQYWRWVVYGILSVIALFVIALVVF